MPTRAVQYTLFVHTFRAQGLSLGDTSPRTSWCVKKISKAHQSNQTDTTTRPLGTGKKTRAARQGYPKTCQHRYPAHKAPSHKGWVPTPPTTPTPGEGQAHTQERNRQRSRAQQVTPAERPGAATKQPKPAPAQATAATTDPELACLATPRPASRSEEQHNLPRLAVTRNWTGEPTHQHQAKRTTEPPPPHNQAAMGDQAPTRHQQHTSEGQRNRHHRTLSTPCTATTATTTAQHTEDRPPTLHPTTNQPHTATETPKTPRHLRTPRPISRTCCRQATQNQPQKYHNRPRNAAHPDAIRRGRGGSLQNTRHASERPEAPEPPSSIYHTEHAKRTALRHAGRPCE